MIKNSKIAVIIPIYNEEETLHNLFYKIDGLHKILKDDYNVKFILINDGSTDDSKKLMIDKYGESTFVDILSHEKNLGYGASLKTGFKKALSEGYHYIVTIDADTNYDQFLIPHFIYEFNPEKEDILAASPWHPECSKNNFPLMRFILSYSMSMLYQAALKPECKPLTCYSACFKLYKREVIENINYRSNDFLTNSEIISLALLKGYKVRELPVSVNYRLFGSSKMKKLHHIIKHLKFLNFLRKNKKILMERS